MYSQTSVSETKIPPPTPQELALISLTTDGMMTSFLEESGYEVQKTTISFEQSDEGKNFASRRSALQGELNKIQSQDQTQAGRSGYGKAAHGPYSESASSSRIMADLDSLRQEEQDARKDYQPKIDYKTEKKLPKDIEMLKQRYGVEGVSTKEGKSYLEREVTQAKSKRDIEDLILQKADKFLRGDFSLNAGENKFLDDVMGPLRQASINAVNFILSEAETSDKSIGSTISEYEKRVKETGMSLDTALVALEDRVTKTGRDMKTALDDEIGMTKSLVKMGLKDFTDQQRLRISNQASLLGRNPSDPEFEHELSDLANKEISRSYTELGRYGAEKRLGIEERTGGGFEEAARARMGIYERTGGGLEQAAQMRSALAERTAGMREEAARLQGESGLRLAEQEGTIRSNLAFGMPPQQIATGINVGQYQNALIQQRIANAQNAMNAPLAIS